MIDSVGRYLSRRIDFVVIVSNGELILRTIGFLQTNDGMKKETDLIYTIYTINERINR